MLTQINDDTWFDLAEVAGVTRWERVEEITPEQFRALVEQTGLSLAKVPNRKFVGYAIISRSGKEYEIGRPFLAAVMRMLGNSMDASFPPTADYAPETDVPDWAGAYNKLTAALGPLFSGDLGKISHFEEVAREFRGDHQLILEIWRILIECKVGTVGELTEIIRRLALADPENSASPP